MKLPKPKASDMALFACALIVSVALAEAALSLLSSKTPPRARLVMTPDVSYEPQPGDVFENEGEMETLDSEGFRGVARAVEKPQGVTRIAVIGDSVAQSYSVVERDSWPRILEKGLAAQGVKAEVLNAGVGGYVSWQVMKRFQKRVARYQPDVVIYLAGWNDLVYSALPDWRPGMDLTVVEQARPASPAQELGLKGFLVSHSKLFSLIRRVRWRLISRRYERETIESHQNDSGIAFNEEALTIYLKNLEETRRVVAAGNGRFVLVVWPALAAGQEGSGPESEISQKTLTFCNVLRLSLQELNVWHARYAQAMRDFAAAHPDVVLVDVARRFDEVPPAQRSSLFTDHAHLTREGNRLLAEEALEGVRKAIS